MALFRKGGSRSTIVRLNFRAERSGDQPWSRTGRTRSPSKHTSGASWPCAGILDEHRAPARPHPERIPQRTLHHGRDQAQTRKYYEFGIEKLLDSDLASRTLRSITRQDCHRSMAQHVRPAEHHDPDRRHRHLDHDRYAPSTVNCVLQTLGRALRIAQETGFLQKVRVIELARKERRRE
jgi:hypothetical protein